jgi:hypothetical protein
VRAKKNLALTRYRVVKQKGDRESMGSSRVWLFRGLVIMAAGFMLLSWFMPWWEALIIQIQGVVQIHPWGLEHNLGPASGFISGVSMPVWFAPVMWTYLVICIVLLFLSLSITGKTTRLGRIKLSLPQLLIGGVGLSYIVIVVAAVIVAAIRTGDLHMKLQGMSIVMEHPEVFAEGRLLIGYWLACGAGPLLIILALLRNRIIGYSRT